MTSKCQPENHGRTGVQRSDIVGGRLTNNKNTHDLLIVKRPAIMTDMLCYGCLSVIHLHLEGITVAKKMANIGLYL